jgi:hypothetical protein
MSSSLFCTLVAAAAGIVAGLWLCMGSAFTSAETIAELATSRWDYNKIHADVVIAQSVQYAVGAPLLVFAFVFQVLAAVAPTDVTLWVPNLLASPMRFLAFIIVLVLGLSFFSYKRILLVKGSRVHALLERRMAENGV